MLPRTVSNRGQNSIKYAGPKAWAEVPNQFKDIAFRKPFSKKFKDHILSVIYEELPPKSTHTPVIQNDDPLNELRALFLNDDENDTFLGFDTSEFADLEFIFSNESDDEEFLGF